MKRSEEAQEEFIRSGFFGDRVDEILEERGLNRKWLAFQLGISPAATTTMLQRNNPKLFTVLQIARIFDMPVSELLDGYEDYLFF